MNASLTQEFHDEALSLFTKTGEATGYWPRYFLRKAKKVGGHKLAQDLLNPSTKTATGFGRLLETNHLELTIEYLAIQPKWAPLFTEAERGVARIRLEEAGWDAVADESNKANLVVFFNNCVNRDHETLFGRGAFYDLNRTGIQALQAVGLPYGQQCVVATMAHDRRVTFSWYSLVRERLVREPGKVLQRVFFGDFLMAEALTKQEAAIHPQYSAFFTVKGHFKQQSTVSASIPPERRHKMPPPEPPDLAKLRQELRHLQNPTLPKTPESLRRVRRILMTYERPNAITRYVKITRGDTCQCCGNPGFLMRSGQRYSEVHHLFHLSKQPPPACLGPEYLVVLCANCHRRMHYADIGEPARTAGGWRVRIEKEDVVFLV